MERLREPDGGCPWDIKQNFSSIVPFTIEEAYEVADAIEREDYADLQSELGDLLFQVIFYSQLGREQELFDFASIVSTVVEKLLRRHPHVFPDGKLQSRSTLSVEKQRIVEEEVKQNWEAIKQRERAEKGFTNILDDVPVGMPALSRAAKLQKRAATVGFDWDDVKPVIDKIKEELAELEDAINQQNDGHIAEELGDLFFAMVNAARHLKKEPETVLRAANRKFIQRFSYIESQLKSNSQSFATTSLAEMEVLWQEAKREEKKR